VLSVRWGKNLTTRNVCVFRACQPTVGQGLLIHEVSRSVMQEHMLLHTRRSPTQSDINQVSH